MTNISKNDFGEGFIETGEGHKVTIKNLSTNEYARFDGDSSSVIKLQKSLLEEQKTNPYYEIWVKPDEINQLKYGKYSPAEKNWYKITIKDVSAKTYLRLHMKHDKLLEMIEEFGLKPKWAIFTR
mgnify:CR=1 FL=1|tara:strand:- start:194 stop:568 length:375 start_codon:yes stop_codon:yes gene_type:complete